MTAEIAILNKSGVALAADSAVTLSGMNGQDKVYYSVSKLFQLSKYHPVGIMIYGSASFISYPWDQLIKHYRAKLNNKQFKTLYEYGEHFIKFITEFHDFDKDNKEKAVIITIRSILNKVRSDLVGKVDSSMKDGNKVSEEVISKWLEEIISDNVKLLDKCGYAIEFNKKIETSIKRKLLKNVNESIESIFEKLPLTKMAKTSLTDLSIMVLTRDISYNGQSGVVISGFGELDMFPRIVSYRIGHIIDGKLNYSIVHKDGVDFDKRALIVPFAQSEMVKLFIEGIDESYESKLIETVAKMFDSYHDSLVQNLNINDAAAQSTLSGLKDELIKNFDKINSEYKTEHYVEPILDSVSALPTSELAEMAEALVNLTSFKRKMSKHIETVGGPTDVALITKGDGFLWIKRKKTFPTEINQHYTCSLFYNGGDEKNE